MLQRVMIVQGQTESVINRWSSHATVARLADWYEVVKLRSWRYEGMVSSREKLENLEALAYEVEVRLKENVQILGHVQENSAF